MSTEYNNPFKLLYRQLWLVDEQKLNQLNATAKVDDWHRLLNQPSVSNIPALVPPANLAAVTPKPLPNQQPSIPVSSITQPRSLQPLKSWDKLVDEVSSCNKCGLAQGRTNVVIERGNRNAQWMFIGEAPGANEDLQGLPFVGVSGELLNKMISAMGLNPQHDVYICNVVKCRPPANRNPDTSEIQSCNNYLLSQIDLVKPKVIITLGRFAIQTILNTQEAVNKLRGKVYNYHDTMVVATFHPSYLLRNPAAKKDAWDDLQLAMKAFKANENID
jgi:DNA polymerase